MHNLHFVTVEASSGTEACNLATEEIEGFGCENNWYVACGAVSQYNEVHASGEGRYQPTDETIESLNETLIKHIKPVLTAPVKDNLEKMARGDTDFEGYVVYEVKKYIEDLYQQSQSNHNDNKFNLLFDEYYARVYDEFGVTILHNTGKPENSTDFIKDGDFNNEEDRLWVVFIDMHS